MRALVLMGVLGVMVAIAVWSVPAAAQQSNGTLHPPYSPDPAHPAHPVYPTHPIYPPWPNAAPTYTPAPRYPTDSRNLTLDNRVPTLWPAGPGVGDATPRLGSPNRESRRGVERMR